MSRGPAGVCGVDAARLQAVWFLVRSTVLEHGGCCRVGVVRVGLFRCPLTSVRARYGRGPRHPSPVPRVCGAGPLGLALTSSAARSPWGGGVSSSRAARRVVGRGRSMRPRPTLADLGWAGGGPGPPAGQSAIIRDSTSLRVYPHPARAVK